MKKNLATAAATAGLVLTAFGASASAQENTYTVHPGDSLWEISHASNISIDNLKAWNHLSSDEIYVNQKLSLAYTVQPGDSLWKLARTFGTTVSELKNLNGLSTDLVRIGQQLSIPGSTGSYVVQKGDSLSEIGVRFNLTVAQLKAVNGLTTDTIKAGQTLNVNGGVTNAVKPSSSAAKSFADKLNPTAGKKAVPALNPDSTTADASNSGVSGKTGVEEKPAVSANTAAVEEKPVVSANTSVSEKSAVSSNTADVEEKPAVSSNTAAVEERPAVSANSTVSEKPAVPSNPTAAVEKPKAAVKPAVVSASKVQDVTNAAKKYIGTPYRWGGNTPAGFDCSGFTKYVFNSVGISLPRTTGTQWDATTSVSSPSIGDLVFFETYKVGPSHVGIYLGNNKFISAASQGVVISDMTSTYWKTRYLGARSPY